MTTPAINEQWYGDYPFDQYVNGVYTTSGSSRYMRVYRVRPASVKVPIVNGYRKVASWNHDRFVYRGSVSGLATWKSGANIITRVGAVWNTQGSLTPPPASSNLHNMVMTKALNKVKRQNVHVGTFLAEGQQTINLVGSTARQIAKTVDAFRHGNPTAVWDAIVRNQGMRTNSRRLRGRTKRINGNVVSWDPRTRTWEPYSHRDPAATVPESWLEVQYGWKPLLSDVDGAMKELAWRQEGLRNIPMVHGRAKGKETSRSSLVSSLEGIASASTECLNKVELKYFFTYGQDLPIMASLSSLGLVDPLEIAWESVPYSFVVDWLAPVGPWLSALSAPSGFRFLTGGYTEFIRTTLGGTVLPKGFMSLTPPGLVLVGDAFTMRRSTFSQTPVPGLYVKSPISLVHMLNGLSLLATAFRTVR